MKERYHHLIHDRLASTLMIVTLTLSFLVVLNVIKIQNEQKIGEHQLEQERYLFEKVYRYDFGDEEPETNMKIDELDIRIGNVIITSEYNQIGDADYYAPMDIVVAYNEPLVEKLQEGRYPTETEIMHERRCVVIGTGLLRFTKKDGKERVLSIDGMEYEVLGILKDVTGNEMDDRMIVFYDALAEQTKARFDKRLEESFDTDILYGSNKGTLEESQVLENWLYQTVDKKYFSMVEEDELEDIEYSYEAANMMREYNKYTLYAMFAFCMCACFLVSSVWIKRRRKEMVVRKALGSSFLKVTGILIKDLGIMIGISIIMDVVFLSMQILVTGNNWIRQDYITDNIQNIGMAVAIILFVTMIRPLYIVATISPAEGTRAL